MEMKFMPLYFSYLKTLAKLTDEEVGRAIRGALEYCTTGTAPELLGRDAVALDFLLADYEAAKENYLKVSSARAEAGRKGAQKRWSSEEHDPFAIPEDGKDGKAIFANGKNGKDGNKKEKEKEIEKEKEKEKKNISTSNEVDSDAPAAVITIPLVGGVEHMIFQQDIDQWKQLYPAVDVMQELRNMRGWCLSNPNKRKTQRGVSAFINRWLAREQDRGGAKKPVTPKQGASQTVATHNAQFQRHGEIGELGKAAIAEMLAWGEKNGGIWDEEDTR